MCASYFQELFRKLQNINSASVDAFFVIKMAYYFISHLNLGNPASIYSLLDTSHQDHNDVVDTPASFTPTLVVCFVLFSIFGAYFFFRYAGARSMKLRYVY